MNEQDRLARLAASLEATAKTLREAADRLDGGTARRTMQPANRPGEVAEHWFRIGGDDYVLRESRQVALSVAHTFEERADDGSVISHGTYRWSFGDPMTQEVADAVALFAGMPTIRDAAMRHRIARDGSDGRRYAFAQTPDGGIAAIGRMPIRTRGEDLPTECLWQRGQAMDADTAAVVASIASGAARQA